MNPNCPTCEADLTEDEALVPYETTDKAFTLQFCSEDCRDEYKEAELDRLRNAGITMGQSLLDLDSREVRGIYAHEERVPESWFLGGTRCRYFGHENPKEENALDGRTQEIIGSAEYCPRCGEVLDVEVER